MSKNWIQPIKQNEYKIFVRFELGQESAKKKKKKKAITIRFLGKKLRIRIIIIRA